ncbi:MAG: tRNA (guanine(46)-N(7))-methyltransferase TrmB [Nannocystaceae bacterium]
MVLDLGCGTGESTRTIAEGAPDHWVFGLDRSEHRLAKAMACPSPENARFVRCDAAHLSALAAAAGWTIQRLYLLYPNPYPKPGHLRRRWHGHPVFPTLARMCASIELRTNWDIYAEEFAQGLVWMGREVERRDVESAGTFTAFERKYLGRGERCYVVRSPA